MGFNFRKSIKVGPARINLSKSGVGYSIGAGGLRYTKSPKRKTSKKKNVSPKATRAKTASPARTSTTAQHEPVQHKRSWALVVMLSIAGVVVVGGGSFIALFICLAIISLFSPDTIGTVGTRLIAFGIPTLLALGTVAIVYFRWRPLPEMHEDDGLSCDVPDENTASQESSLQKDLAEAVSKFENDLAAIPNAEVILSAPVKRQLLKDLPDYSFSNVTRKTRLDSIFPLVVIDVETTDLRPSSGEIVEVAAIKFDYGMVPVEKFTSLCKPKKAIPDEITKINGIATSMVDTSPSFAEIAPALAGFLKGCHIVGHNLDFDLRFIHAHGVKLPENVRFYDTLDLAQLTIPRGHTVDYKLNTLCFYYGIWRDKSHRALSDCFATAKLFEHLVLDKTGRELVNELSTKE